MPELKHVKTPDICLQGRSNVFIYRYICIKKNLKNCIRTQRVKIYIRNCDQPNSLKVEDAAFDLESMKIKNLNKHKADFACRKAETYFFLLF